MTGTGPDWANDIDFDELRAMVPDLEIGDPLGSGGFAVVFRAWDPELERWVAIKVLRVRNEIGRQAFRAEARAQAKLDLHPHIVRIHRSKAGDKYCLIVMEYMAGGTLEKRADLAGPEACACALALAYALQHAHSHGVLHRDVKTSNALIDAKGRIALADLGIAKVRNGLITRASREIGTTECMAPEQFDAGGELGDFTDVYGLGGILLELFGGSMALTQRLLKTPPVPLDVPTPVADVIRRALHPRHSERFQTAESFAVALDHACRAAYGDDWLARSGIRVWRESAGGRDAD